MKTPPDRGMMYMFEHVRAPSEGCVYVHVCVCVITRGKVSKPREGCGGRLGGRQGRRHGGWSEGLGDEIKMIDDCFLSWTVI